MWYTVKKGLRFSRPQPGCHFPNSPWPGIIKLFLARESLVSEIPAGDGKIANLFYSVCQEMQKREFWAFPLTVLASTMSFRQETGHACTQIARMWLGTQTEIKGTV
jgi:hypothetical protein